MKPLTETEIEHYHALDNLGVAIGSDEKLAEILMRTMGLTYERDLWVLDPDLRDSSTRVMRAWLIDNGYLPKKVDRRKPTG